MISILFILKIYCVKNKFSNILFNLYSNFQEIIDGRKAKYYIAPNATKFDSKRTTSLR
jgi:hypothetical protein